MPNAFAVKKWPDSWISTTARIATTNTRMPSHSAIVGYRASRISAALARAHRSARCSDTSETTAAP